MDENNHTQEKLDSECLHHADDELENWTFVNSEDSVSVGKIGNAEINSEDLSDNGSEQGSDSGSSIVVIDTTYSSYSRDNSHNVDLSPSYKDVGSDNLQEPESTRSDEQVEEFTKEQSPFFVVGNSPSLWVTQECSQGMSECSTNTDDDKPKEGSVAITAGEAANLVAVELSNSDSLQDHLSQNDNRAEVLDIKQEPVGEVNDAAAFDDVGVYQAEGAGASGALEKKDLADDNLTQEDERNQRIQDDQEMPQLLASISSAEDLDEAIRLDENEFLNDAEGEESDEENWDLGVEAQALSASLTSSISSLTGQPNSPSPFVLRGENHGSNLVKPDLLEEANRIEELDQYDYSTVTNPDLPPELNVGAILRERAYVHRPNQRLNVQLSYFVAFVLAAVFGFALGNLIGLADNFPSRCPSLKPQPQTVQFNNGWREQQWRSEVQRLTALNEELKLAAQRSAEELRELTAQNSQFDLRLNELITENFDLKQSVGRIRYGKPVRSIEDRHTINILQTENQELRSTVGKLRYKCGQGHSLADQQTPYVKMDETIFDVESRMPISRDSLLKLLGAVNRTSELNKFVGSSQEILSLEKVSILQDSAANLVELITLRRDELANMTKENNLRSVEKMRASLNKAASKVLNVLERLQNHQTSWEAAIEEEQTRVDKIRAKVENRWEKFLNSPDCSDETCPIGMKTDSFDRGWSNSVAGTSEGLRKRTTQERWSLDKKVNFHDNNFSKDRESSLDPEWFLVMGRKREKIRRDEEKSEWLFERAKNRDQERRLRKYQRKERKPKASKDGAWKHYAA